MSRTMSDMASKKGKKKATKKATKKGKTAAKAKGRGLVQRPSTTARSGAKKRSTSRRPLPRKPPPGKAGARKSAGRKPAPGKAVARGSALERKAAARAPALPKRAEQNPAAQVRGARPRAAAGGPAKAVRRQSRPGHFDPAYAADLLGRTPRDNEPRAFIESPRSPRDDLAEQLGEEFVEAATTGENDIEETLDEVVPEEQGGPFVETNAEQEFAGGTDPSNPKDAEREPFPTT